MPRVNRAIELLEQDQPIYYTGVEEISYAGGVAAAETWADYLIVDMEHCPFNPTGLAEFMGGGWSMAVPPVAAIAPQP